VNDTTFGRLGMLSKPPAASHSGNLHANGDHARPMAAAQRRSLSDHKVGTKGLLNMS
jgi:hypothetical protein